jgi:hypothetical protein
MRLEFVNVHQVRVYSQLIQDRLVNLLIQLTINLIFLSVKLIARVSNNFVFNEKNNRWPITQHHYYYSIETGHLD